MSLFSGHCNLITPYYMPKLKHTYWTLRDLVLNQRWMVHHRLIKHFFLTKGDGLEGLRWRVKGEVGRKDNMTHKINPASLRSQLKQSYSYWKTDGQNQLMDRWINNLPPKMTQAWIQFRDPTEFLIFLSSLLAL